MQIVQPELLNEGESGKSDASWLTVYKNFLSTTIHKENNKLEELTDAPATDKAATVEQLKKASDFLLIFDHAFFHDFLYLQLDRLIATAGMLQETSRYLHWFTNRVQDSNDSLPEFDRDFSVTLVVGWITSTLSRAKEHEQNIFVSLLCLFACF